LSKRIKGELWVALLGGLKMEVRSAYYNEKRSCLTTMRAEARGSEKWREVTHRGNSQGVRQVERAGAIQMGACVPESD